MGLVGLSAISFGQGNFQIVKPLINSQNVHNQESTIIRIPSEKSTDLVWLSFKYSTNENAGLEFATSHDGEQWSEWKKVLVDSHSTDHDDLLVPRVTEMLQLPTEVRYIKCKLAQGVTKLEAHFYSEGIVNNELGISQMAGCQCETIPYKSRTQWACPDGVEAPAWPPVLSSARTFVIHHQAGSANPPYDATVRAIWNYHTNSNGWGDIGYNWLIAPDGTVYQGRAWVGDQLEEVRGAHMCSCNSNKIGICLMGDLTSAQPTAAAYASLVKLIGAKACQFDIAPDSTDVTPVRAPQMFCIDSLMPNIIGHKHGCPAGYTACPGDAFSPKVIEVRSAVASYITNCLSSTDEDEQKPFSLFLSPNPSVDFVDLSLNSGFDHDLIVNVYNMMGQKIMQEYWTGGLSSFRLNWPFSTSGMVKIVVQSPSDRRTSTTGVILAR